MRIGVAGLGRAFTLMAPTFAADARVALVAAADPRPEARAQFERDFRGRAYATVKELCADAAFEVLYVATPHQFHAEHARLAFAAGKHALVEKPMALTLDECRAMVDAARAAGRHLIVGHSHSFDAPIQRTRELIASGAYGRLRMITALNFTDFLYRPRRPEELDTTRGGGAVYNQAAHHVDIARLLAGGRAKSVRAQTGAWDPARPTEGAYSALIAFEDGAFATITYSGYAHFDSDEFTGWIGEGGQKKDPAAYGAARRALTGDEMQVKNARNYGGAQYAKAHAALAHQHFGVLIASCEHADLRPLPEGVWIYTDGERRLEALPSPKVQRSEVIDELYAALVDGRPPQHDGAWALATTEVCLAILQSAAEQQEITLRNQTALRT
ncbi:MAG: Gfo/Idh/MocA family oxidoreductase [Betaproteobacteria bacterium]|nr:MAG: Gfo/Idh/MocA family oxidoreductase [Betaproteobacteria bacterium]